MRVLIKMVIKQMHNIFRGAVDYECRRLKTTWNFLCMFKRMKKRVRFVNSGNNPEERNH
jgi:hypothetical protein